MNRIQKYSQKILQGQYLDIMEAQDAFTIILNGGATVAQISSFLSMLALRKESLEELLGALNTLWLSCDRKIDTNKIIVDCCGTGGDNKNSLNISTAVAFVVAGTGLAVAKHGNRAMSSQSGSADVVRLCGVNLNLSNESTEKILLEANISFLLAPNFYPKMKNIADIRRDMGIRTLFNLIGPLLNPVNISYQIIGVPNVEIGHNLARVIAAQGKLMKAWIVSSADGYDELSIFDKNFVIEVEGSTIKEFEISYSDLLNGNDVSDYKVFDIEGGSPKYNKKQLEELLKGKKGAYQDMVCFNAAAILYIANQASSLSEGFHMAQNSIDSGAAMSKLRKLIELSSVYGFSIDTKNIH